MGSRITRVSDKSVFALGPDYFEWTDSDGPTVHGGGYLPPYPSTVVGSDTETGNGEDETGFRSDTLVVPSRDWDREPWSLGVCQDDGTWTTDRRKRIDPI